MAERYDPASDVGLNERMKRPREIYLAGPFFSDGQVQELRLVEQALVEAKLDFYSPRLECLYKRGDERKVAQRCAWLNRFHIRRSKLVLAGLTWADMGTAWELGYADADRIPRIGFTSDHKVGLNLMVRETVDALIPFDKVPDALNAIGGQLMRGRTFNRELDQLSRYFDETWKGLME